MRRISWQRFFLLLGSLSLPGSAVEEPPLGIIVISVAPDSPAAQAGVQVGDVLLSYGGTPLVFVSSLDQAREKAEAAKQETVTVELRRGEETWALTLPTGKLGVTVRPPLPAAAQALWEEGQVLPAEAITERAEKWQAAAAAAQQASDPRAAAWLWEQAGEQWYAHQLLDREARAHAQAAKQAEAAGDARGAGDAFNQQGAAAGEWGDLLTAREAFQRALEIRERLGPDSLAVSGSLVGLGGIAFMSGDTAKAREYFQRALVIREQLDPDSLNTAQVLSNLGNVNCQEGDLAGAQEYFRRALVIRDRLDPDSLNVALSLTGLGNVALQQGDLAQAHECFLRALTLFERLSPGHPGIAQSLASLGSVALQQGDLVQAHECFLRALTLFERLSPDSPNASGCLANLGVVAHVQGDLDKAQEYYRQALALFERLSLDSLYLALLYDNLGLVAMDQGNLAEAQKHFQQALEIGRQAAPSSLAVADSLVYLGQVVWKQGDLPQATRCFRQALHLAQDRNGFHTTVLSSAYLGQILAAQGDLDGASKAYQLCLDTLDEWRTFAGREAEEQVGLFAQYTFLFPDYGALLLNREQPAAAFHVSERGKARSLLDALTQGQRKTGLTAEEVRQEADLERELAVAQHALERLQVQPELDKDALQPQITVTVAARQALATFRRTLYERHPDLRAERGELQPLTEEHIKGLPLPAKALVLSFLVGEEETLVFALHRPTADAPVELTVWRLPEKAEALAETVRDVRGALSSPRRADSGAAQAALRRLSGTLLGPLKGLLQPGQLLLLCPDGVLWDVPWAALPLPGSEDPMIREHAISLIPSVTVLDWLLRRPSPPREAPRLLAVGNPSLEWAKREEAGKPVQVALAPTRLDFLARVRDGDETERGQLLPLPQAEAEVQHLRALYGPQAEVLIGEEATEESVKAGLGEATVLHFATHGVMDDGMPMQSGLLLNRGASGEEDGRLTAREIMRLSLKADVAVLSACQTARGRRENGEGILGLSWAFVSAGVPQVVVSQWKVADDSTAVLMVKFHEGLRAGLGVAEALRRAQIAVRSEERWASPYHWAAFVTVGTGQ